MLLRLEIQSSKKIQYLGPYLSSWLAFTLTLDCTLFLVGVIFEFNYCSAFIKPASHSLKLLASIHPPPCPARALSHNEGSWLVAAGGSWAGRQLWWLQLYYSLCCRAVIRWRSCSAGCWGNVMFTAIPIHTQT